MTTAVQTVAIADPMHQLAASLPQVAVNRNGSAVTAWQQRDNLTYNIWAGRLLEGAQWDAGVLLESDDEGDASSPQVAMDGAGNATAVWNQSNGTRFDIWSSRFAASTGWGIPVMIETDEVGGANAPDVASDAVGNVVAVWRVYYQTTTASEVWANRFEPGVGWGAAVQIGASASGYPGEPQVAVGGGGIAIAVWPETSGPEVRIWANRFVPGTGWGEALVLGTQENARVPQVAVDADGRAIAVWAAHDSTLRQNVWASRFDPILGWSEPAFIGVDNGGNAMDPQVAMDATGAATVVWFQSDGTRHTIWASRFEVDRGWGTPSVLESDTMSIAPQQLRSRFPQVAVAPAGDVIAVWQQWTGTLNRIGVASFE